MMSAAHLRSDSPLVELGTGLLVEVVGTRTKLAHVAGSPDKDREALGLCTTSQWRPSGKDRETHQEPARRR